MLKRIWKAIRKTRKRMIVVSILSVLLIGGTATIAAAAHNPHWHRILLPSHKDKFGVWLGTPFPFTVDFRGITQQSGCLHTDIIKYTEWVTGANDYHYLRHAHC